MKNDWSWLGYVIGFVAVVGGLIYWEWNKKRDFGWVQDQYRYIKIEEKQFDRLINALEKIAEKEGKTNGIQSM